MRYIDKLYTNDMQFAFKEKHSTMMCSLVVKEVVHYYINNKSDVYSCCVDAMRPLTGGCIMITSLNFLLRRKFML